MTKKIGSNSIASTASNLSSTFKHTNLVSLQISEESKLSPELLICKHGHFQTIRRTIKLWFKELKQTIEKDQMLPDVMILYCLNIEMAPRQTSFATQT